uniref:Uncharacterized protein n=1 Tax=Lactuca sativa TaxID=4236 RepID=A0A9R1XN24_LACSA|nr:hypothetical protein LSAT_V11C300150930 [Lactuca sativa]
MEKKITFFIVLTLLIVAVSNPSLVMDLIVVLTAVFKESPAPEIFGNPKWLFLKPISLHIYLIVFLLFAVSTIYVFLDPVDVLTDVSKSSPVSVADGDETPDVNTIDPPPRTNFPVVRPMIKRYFFDTLNPLKFGRYLCGKFEKKLMIPRTKRSHVKDIILSGESDSFDPETSRDLVPKS